MNEKGTMKDGWRSQPRPAHWARTRRRILRRDGHACRLCGAPATDVDHVIPASQGGTDADSNLQAICQACHGKKTAQEANAGRPKRQRPAEKHPGDLT
jgi:5-methylcytosine-specific restriction enzyme A